MKTKPDWVVIAAAVGVGFSAHVILTAESAIFPAFVGAVMLQCLVHRLARRPS